MIPHAPLRTANVRMYDSEEKHSLNIKLSYIYYSIIINQSRRPLL